MLLIKHGHQHCLLLPQRTSVLCSLLKARSNLKYYRTVSKLPICTGKERKFPQPTVCMVTSRALLTSSQDTDELCFLNLLPPCPRARITFDYRSLCVFFRKGSFTDL